MKKDKSVYVLAGSILVSSMMINTNSASSAFDPNTSKIAALESKVSRLQSDLDRMRFCINNNFRAINSFDASRSSRMSSVNSCF